jgi:hypothetical protein
VSVTGDTELIAILEEAITHVPDGARGVVSKGSLNVKNEWKRSWSRIAHAPHVGRSISYDITDHGEQGVESEIGPVDDALTQGFLGGILEFGGLHSGPVPGGLPALANEEPKFLKAIEALSEELLP